MTNNFTYGVAKTAEAVARPVIISANTRAIIATVSPAAPIPCGDIVIAPFIQQPQQ